METEIETNPDPLLESLPLSQNTRTLIQHIILFLKNSRLRRSDGTTHLVFTPLELIEKLAALVPPPRFNQLRYHGILSPNAKYRPRVVPGKKKNEEKSSEKCKSQKKRKNISQIRFVELING
jgi:Putative transposase